MSSIKTRQLTNRFFVVVAAVSLIFCFSSCATKINFLNSSVVPAARGDVKVKKDDNNNYHIDISLANLAEPNRLQPPRNTYVVWMETDNNVVKSIGQINSSTGFLSGKLKSAFETVSATKPTKIFLTAEDDGQVQYPSSQVVLTTNNF